MVLTDGELSLLGPFVPADEDVPHEGALPDLYRLGADHGVGMWRGRYAAPAETIVLWVDEDECDFHIDAKDGYKASDMRAALEVARSRGLEPLDEDECEPEILEDGTVRIYLAAVTEYAVVQPAAPARPACSIVRRAASSFALAACIASALLLPSPVSTSYPDAINEVFDSFSTDQPGTVQPAPKPKSPNEGVLSGPESSGDSATVQARASESLRASGRVEQAADRSLGRGETSGTHPDYDFHRLHRGQVELDRLAGAYGPARIVQAARLAGSR